MPPVKATLKTIPPSLFQRCHGVAIATGKHLLHFLRFKLKGILRHTKVEERPSLWDLYTAVFQVAILLGGAKGGAGVVIRKDKNGQWGNPIGFGLVGGQVSVRSPTQG